MRPHLAALAFLALALPGFAAPGAQATHWCADLQISVDPTFAFGGTSNQFFVRAENVGTNDTQLTAVDVRFSWAGTWTTIGARLVAAGTTETFLTSGTPPAQGPASVDVRVTGWQVSPADSGSCAVFTQSLTLTSAPDVGGFFSGLIIGIILFVVVIIAVVVIVVVVATRQSKPPPTAPPPYAPPPPPTPPQAPPSAPP